MKRKAMSRGQSKRVFKNGTGVQKMNVINPKNQRGGIRL